MLKGEWYLFYKPVCKKPFNSQAVPSACSCGCSDKIRVWLWGAEAWDPWPWWLHRAVTEGAEGSTGLLLKCTRTTCVSCYYCHWCVFGSPVFFMPPPSSRACPSAALQRVCHQLTSTEIQIKPWKPLRDIKQGKSFLLNSGAWILLYVFVSSFNFLRISFYLYFIKTWVYEDWSSHPRQFEKHWCSMQGVPFSTDVLWLPVPVQMGVAGLSSVAQQDHRGS